MSYIITHYVIFYVFYTIGITAESMTGAISAGRRQMDLFGIITIATITALGGGTVRDVLLGHYPLIWVAHPEYLFICIFAAFLAIYINRYITRLHKFFLVLDALGLVTFAYLGSNVGYFIATQVVHTPYFTEVGVMIIAVVMAIVTGVSGGVLRDILCNDIPLVFTAELYAVVAGLVGFLHWITLTLDIDNAFTAMIIIALGFGIRLLAIYRKWQLPKMKIN